VKRRWSTKYLLEFERGAGLFSARLRWSVPRLRKALDARGGSGALPGDAARLMNYAAVAAEPTCSRYWSFTRSADARVDLSASPCSYLVPAATSAADCADR
jgi:hypothetical protein